VNERYYRFDICGHLDGTCITYDGVVLTVGSWTHCARALTVAQEALDALEYIFALANQKHRMGG
jgi:hypothetical protein